MNRVNVCPFGLLKTCKHYYCLTGYKYIIGYVSAVPYANDEYLFEYCERIKIKRITIEVIL